LETDGQPGSVVTAAHRCGGLAGQIELGENAHHGGEEIFLVPVRNQRDLCTGWRRDRRLRGDDDELDVPHRFEHLLKQLRPDPESVDVGRHPYEETQFDERPGLGQVAVARADSSVESRRGGVAPYQATTAGRRGECMLHVGVDIGGTFTDLFAWDHEAGGRERVREAKVLTTPADPSVGVMGALEVAGIDPTDIGTLVHGTTIATNALIERKYPEPALVTTRGFRDVLEIGRQRRRHLYDPYQAKVPPLISRSRRFTVSEKLGADGSPVTPLDRDEARRVAERIAELGIGNVAIAFINAYQDGRHEREMRDVLLEVIPDAEVALSSETRPKVRELGRFVTTAVRAALLPVVGDYVGNLERKLRAAGSRAPLFIVKSNGGMMSAATAKERPEELIESGPAGGVAAGSYLSELLDEPSLIITDVGGTSFEASLMEDGLGLVTDEYEIEWERPLITPMLDIRSIGAGGGSIAWIDDGGSLRVGPQSAGADPGPACYGRGGTRPTVTDANLVLGRLDPTLGGKLELDVDAATEAIRTVAEPLGMSVLDCAEGITQIVSENMAVAIRGVSTDRGRDPRDHTLVAFGGAGGMHAHAIAKAVGIQSVLVPPFAGVACAFGATTMDVRHDLETTFFAPAADTDVAALNDAFAGLEADVRRLLEADGIAPADVALDRSAQMRYVGQSYEVTTPVPAGELDAAAVEDIAREFHVVHEREYGVASDTFPVAFVTLRVTGIGRTSKPSSEDLAGAIGTDGAGNGSRKERRRVYFGGRHYEVDVYDVHQLSVDQEIAGPAIIEQPDGVIVLPPGSVGRADRFDNVLMMTEEESA
jgi:N-methylhydantoinase A